MSDNPLYAELDRLRTELADTDEAMSVLALMHTQLKERTARLEEQRAKAEERAREMKAEMAVMRKALEWAAHAIDAAGLGSADDLDLLDKALAIKEAPDASAE